MAFGIGGSKKNSKQSTNETATQSLDPTLSGALYGNVNRVEGLLGSTPTQYSGAGLNLSQPINAAQGLLGYYAPQISAAQLNRGNIRDVSAGSVSASEIAQFMNPYEGQVVDASMADLDRARQMSQLRNTGMITKAGAFNTPGAAVMQSESNDAFARAAANSSAGLRSQGFTTALGAAQTEAVRKLQAALANQGVDLSAEQANAMLTQQTSQANQSADLASAGVRSGAASLLGGLEQSQYGADYGQYQDQFNRQLQLQQLMNQALGLIPTTGTTTSNGITRGASTEIAATGTYGK